MVLALAKAKAEQEKLEGLLKQASEETEELLIVKERQSVQSLEDQKSMIRRLGVKVSELAEIRGQSNITNYFTLL